jgi:hypothetical protein
VLPIPFWAVCLILLAFTGTVPDFVAEAAPIDAFVQIIEHVRRQVTQDKQQFATADTCTQWFYQQLRPRKSAPRPSVEPIAWHPSEKKRLLNQPVSGGEPARPDCATLYPKGLEQAREAFSLTQTSLSISLTFYEFALVADRDDDGQYSQPEIRDFLRALDLQEQANESNSADTAASDAAHGQALKTKFDRIYQNRSLDLVVTGMGHLYDSGYRLTPADRHELDQVTR